MADPVPLLVVAGIVIAGVGMAMEGDGVREVEVCVSTGELASENPSCPTVTEERYVENDLKMPLTVGGGLTVLIGLILALDDV